MAEVVDAVVAELVLRGLQQYETGFDRATAAHGRFQKSVDGLKGQTFDLQAEAQKYRQGGASIGAAAEQTDQRISRSRKKRAADSVAADEAEVVSAKRAAKTKADAEIAEQRRAQAALKRYYAAGPRIFEAKAKEISARNAAAEAAKKEAAEEVAAAARVAAAEEAKAARLRAVAERAVAARTVTAGSGRIPNSDLSRGGAPLFIPPSVLNGGAQAEAAATEEIDHLTRDIAVNKARLVGLEGREREELQREIAYLETYNRLKRAGVAETEAQVLAERQLVATQHRAGGGLGQANQFALAATGGRLGYSFSPGAVAGVGVAIGAAVTIQAVDTAINYAKALKNDADQLGITTRQLQIYRAEAERLGVTQEQLTSGIGQFTSNLGRAQEGAEQQQKIFRALNVDIGNAKEGFRSASDVLPEVIDRLSSLQDQAQRAAVETALFGESGRKLDGLLSGGTDALNNLGDAMDHAGHVLSEKDIQSLNEAATALSDLKQQLTVDISRVVANNAGAIVSLAGAVGSLADRIGDAAAKAAQFHRIGAQQGGWLGGAIGTVLGAGVGLFGGADDTGRDSLRSGNMPGVLDGVLHPGRPQANGGLLNNLFAPKRPRGKSADTLAREAEQRTKRFQDDLSRFQEEELRAQESLTGDINTRADIEAALAKRAYDRQVADIESEQKQNVLRGADAKLEAARAAQLKDAAKAVYDEQAAGIQQQRRIDLARSANDNEQRLLQFQGEHLNNELALANTSADRRRIELQLLENAKAQERARLQGVIDTSLPGSPEAASAAGQLKTLGARYDDQRAGIIRQTETSLDAYKRSLEVTSDTISDFGVHILQDFNQELDHSIAKALHLHGVFGEIVGDLIDMAIKQELIAPTANSGGFSSFLGSIAKLFGGGAPSVDVGGITNATNSLLDSGLPGLANGGTGIIGGKPGIDQNVLSINGRKVAKVGRGELLSVTPNVALANQRVAATMPQQTVLVVQPIHADFSGARTDEQTMRAFTAYADVRSKQAYEAAVATAGSQVGGIVQRKQTLGN